MQRRTFLAGLAVGATVMTPVATADAATIGISDQNAETFTNQFFSQIKARNARYVLPYDFRTDTSQNPSQKQRFEAWYAAARRANQRVFVSFEHSRQSASAARRLPSVAAYTREIRAFKAEYPAIRDVGVWNEVNRQLRSGGEGQPTARNPRRAAQYFDAARRVFTGSRYRLVGLDLLDEQNVGSAISYLRRFRAATRNEPRYFGLHNYSDTNRFSQTRTRRLIREIGRRGEIWLTETGGIVQLGSAEEGSFRRSESRANRALGCMFDIARDNPRIKRLYIYNYFGTEEVQPFDAGLVSADGSTRRPGFQTVVSRRARNCG